MSGKSFAPASKTTLWANCSGYPWDVTFATQTMWLPTRIRLTTCWFCSPRLVATTLWACPARMTLCSIINPRATTTLWPSEDYSTSVPRLSFLPGCKKWEFIEELNHGCWTRRAKSSCCEGWKSQLRGKPVSEQRNAGLSSTGVKRNPDGSEFRECDLPEIVRRIRAQTPARLLMGRSGSSYLTSTQLELREAHAAARDAVRTELELNRDLGAELVCRWDVFEVCTQAADKDEYLLRPDLGRRFSVASRTEILRRCPGHRDLQIAIGLVCPGVPGSTNPPISGAKARSSRLHKRKTCTISRESRCRIPSC